DSVDARPRPARLRLLRSQHPRAQRRRLHDVPRPGGSDAAHVAGAVAPDGVVSGLPSEPGTIRASARRGVPRRLHAAAGSARAREAARRRVSDSEAHELLDVPPMNEDRAREFVEALESTTDPVERRTFLKLMGASMALAGVAGCTRQPPELIVPYVR